MAALLLLLLSSDTARFDFLPTAPAAILLDVPDMLLLSTEPGGVGAWEGFGPKKLVKERCCDLPGMGTRQPWLCC